MMRNGPRSHKQPQVQAMRLLRCGSKLRVLNTPSASSVWPIGEDPGGAQLVSVLIILWIGVPLVLNTNVIQLVATCPCVSCATSRTAFSEAGVASA